MRTPSPTLILRIALALLLILAPSLHAQPAQAPRGDALDALREAPPATNLLIAIQSPAELANTPIGAAALDLALQLGAFEDTRQAWATLAKALGVSQTHAADLLLSRRVTLVTADTPPAWALTTTIDRPTANLLRKRLSVAARGLTNGVPIFELENGAIELALAPSPDAAPANTPELWRLIIGPADAPKLLDDLAASLTAKAPRNRLRPLSTRDDLRPLLEEPLGADILILARQTSATKPNPLNLPEPNPTDPNPTGFNLGLGLESLGMGNSAWFAAAIRIGDRGAAASLYADGDAAADLARAITPSTLDHFQSLEAGSLIAILEEAAPNAASPSFIAVLADLFQIPWPATSEKLLDGQVAFAAYPSTEGGLLDIVAAHQTSDLNAIAQAGDRFVADLLGAFATTPTTTPIAGGLTSTTLLTVPRAVNLAPYLSDAAKLAWPKGPTMQWTYRPTTQTKPTTTTPGWWVMGLGPQSVTALTDLLIEPPTTNADPTPHRWLSVGSLHIRDLLKQLAPLDGFTQALTPLRRIEVAQWRLRAIDAPEPGVRGELAIILAP